MKESSDKYLDLLRLVVVILLLITSQFATAQSSSSPLEQYLLQYSESQPDSNKVRLLLKIDSFYLYKMPDEKNIFDSALTMSRQAIDLSSSLHFEWGYHNAVFMLANTYAEMNNVPAALSIMNSTLGAERVAILIMLGEHYIFKPDRLRQNLDTAYPLIQRAVNLSDSLHSVVCLYRSLCLLGKFYFFSGSFEKGKSCFMRMINDYHNAGDAKNEADWWAELGRYMPHADSSYKEAMHSFQQADAIYHRLNLKREEADMVAHIAYLNQLHNDLDKAETGYLDAISIKRSVGYQKLFINYSSLAEINRLKGNYNISLLYALAAVRNMDSLGELSMGGVIYFQLANAYSSVGETEKSLQWYYKSLDHLIDYKSEFGFNILGQIVYGLLKQGKAIEATKFIKKFVHEHPAYRLVDKEMIAASEGDCFNALGKYDLAEKSYLRMIEFDDQVLLYLNKESQGETGNKITGSNAYYTIGQFYTERGKYKIARPYLTKSLNFESFAPSLSLQKDIHWVLFKIDSAEGNYLSAINHLENCRILTDSIFNVTKSKQIAELQIQYEIKNKEQDLQVLRSREQLQNQALQEAAQARKFTYLVVSILIILMGVGYSRYRLKQKSNLLLQAHQKEIGAQNLRLMELNMVQEKLLTEKELLVREIHHRVKNNLQIVISLLNAQSEYLDNPSAIQAIFESRERMRAIALIHQKLDRPDQPTIVNMKAYIQEMVTYLSNGIIQHGTIHFELNLDDINLDISQAVPVGLILNEAITNAVKYAFLNGRHGTVSIVFKRLDDKDLFLSIADNGRGFPEGFDISTNNSLGIELMQLFAEQLEGDILFKNQDGLEISLVFKQLMAMGTVNPFVFTPPNGKNINR